MTYEDTSIILLCAAVIWLYVGYLINKFKIKELEDKVKELEEREESNDTGKK